MSWWRYVIMWWFYNTLLSRNLDRFKESCTWNFFTIMVKRLLIQHSSWQKQKLKAQLLTSLGQQNSLFQLFTKLFYNYFSLYLLNYWDIVRQYSVPNQKIFFLVLHFPVPVAVARFKPSTLRWRGEGYTTLLPLLANKLFRCYNSFKQFYNFKQCVLVHHSPKWCEYVNRTLDSSAYHN